MSDWIAGRAVARSLHRSSHSIVADLDSQPVQNAAARQSPRGVADQPYDLANPCRPASMGSGNFRYRFSKDLAGTSWGCGIEGAALSSAVLPHTPAKAGLSAGEGTCCDGSE